MKNHLFIILLALVFTKASYSENLTKQDLLKMSPSQIIVYAKNGDPMAQLWLGDAISNGSIPNWRSYSSCEWYYKSAEQNNSDAAFKLYNYIRVFENLGKIFDCPKVIVVKKTNLNKNYWLLKSARLQNREAQFELWKISKDNSEKLNWLKKSAEKEYPPAMINLAKYLSGQIFYLKPEKKDLDKALSLLIKASKASNKNSDADYELANLFSNKLYFDYINLHKSDLKKGKKESADYWLKEANAQNFKARFNIKKAIKFANNCINKSMEFRCYELAIGFYTEDQFKNLNYDKALVFLNEAEEYLKEAKEYHRVLFLKGKASLSWPNLNKNKLEANKYFRKAKEILMKSNKNDYMISIYEKWISYTS